MLSIEAPKETAAASFGTCISIVEDPDLKGRLESVAAYIESADTTFQNHAKAATLHLLKAEDGVDGKVTTDEMKRVYESRMVRRKTPGRAIYDSLLSRAPRGLCPLCAQRTANTLDHHLPKASFPTLAVAPANLVPACGECNKVKLSELPTAQDRQTLHPYFDEIDSVSWLSARVIEKKPTAAIFFVSPPSAWSTLLTLRVKYHFETLKLGSLYASQAATELAAIRHRLSKLYATGGAHLVRRHLEDDAESREFDRLNSWMTAIYKAWATNDWFCNDGFSA